METKKEKEEVGEKETPRWAKKKNARLTSEGRREQKEATEQHYIQHL